MSRQRSDRTFTWGWLTFVDPWGKRKEMWFNWRLRSTFAGTGCFVDELEHTLRLHRRVEVQIEGVKAT